MNPIIFGIIFYKIWEIKILPYWNAPPFGEDEILQIAKIVWLLPMMRDSMLNEFQVLINPVLIIQVATNEKN